MNDPNSLAVDLIIPALNEQDNMKALFATLPTAQLRHVIVVDNGSTDQTAALARSAGAIVVHEPYRGYGSACLAGLIWITAQHDPPDIIAFIDADLADDPAMLITLCQTLVHQKADMVIGSRKRLAQRGTLTRPQRWGNRIACTSIRLLTGKSFTDLGPMRALKWSSLNQLNMKDRTWGWTVEMQFKAASKGLHVLEIDVPYRFRRAGASKISGSVIGSIRAGSKILATLAKLWWQHRRIRRAKDSPQQDS